MINKEDIYFGQLVQCLIFFFLYLLAKLSHVDFFYLMLGSSLMVAWMFYNEIN